MVSGFPTFAKASVGEAGFQGFVLASFVLTTIFDGGGLEPGTSNSKL